jgi:hypothetical protein
VLLVLQSDIHRITDPLPMFGYPHTGDRHYMANGQLPWLTLFSQQDAPGLAWRSGIHGKKTKKGLKQKTV